MLKLKRIFVGLVAVTTFGFVVGSVGAEGKVVATFADSYLVGPESGWRILWNAKGEVGDPASYVPLNFSSLSKNGKKHYANEAGDIIVGGSCFVPGCAKGGTRRYAVCAYDWPENVAGDAWLTNGNYRCVGRPGLLKVYVNSELKYESDEVQGREPLLFQCSLGQLKKGDTVYLAFATAGVKKGGGQLHFTLESFPKGEKPKGPANIISPAPDASAPKLAPDGRPLKKYVDTHEAHRQGALAQKPKLVFYGDSITARWPKEIYQGKLAKYKPFNMGYGGDWMQNTLWRVRNGVLSHIKPKAVVLLIGTNNVSHRCTADEVVAGNKAIIEEIHKQSPDTIVVLMGIFPRGRSIHNNRPYETVKKINAKLKEFADSNDKVVYLDIGDKLVEPDGTITKEMMRDGLHIGKPGFVIWADALVPVLEKNVEWDTQ